MIMKINSY